MSKRGTEKKPIIVRVQTEERAQEVAIFCNERGWKFTIGIDPNSPEDLSHLQRALGPTQSVRSTKVGRNEPCVCGSGRKYKHCCGA